MIKKKDNKQIDIEEVILHQSVLRTIEDNVNNRLPPLSCIRAIAMVNFRILDFIEDKNTREIIKNLSEQILINCNK